MVDHHQLSNFIWQIADLLRGPYRPPQYERVMLPMTVLRRFDCVLAPTKPQVLAKNASVENNPNFQSEALDKILNEAANETAGDHFTPREVIRLMVAILFDPDDDILTKPGIIRKVLDPACGTGGMLAEAQNYLREHNAKAQLWVFGQDFNPRAYAIAASDLLMKGNEKSDIRFGDSLINDQFPEGDAETNGRFDYLIANPPFGVDWKKQYNWFEFKEIQLGVD